MANVNAYIQTFAGGEFGDAMSARVAIDSYQASCELSENWFPKAQGPMDRRPSLEYIDSFLDSTKRGHLKKLEFDVGQNYLLNLTEGRIDYYLNDGLLTTDEVTAAISNGTFGTFTGWSDASQSGSSASASGGYLNLNCNGPASAIARTTFTVNEANSIHVIAFDVEEGMVNISVGTSAGSSAYMGVRDLRRGHHRLAFVPTATGTCHLEFWYKGTDSIKKIDNVSILAGPSFFLPAPWAEDDMRGVYTSQDGDRLYMFHRDYPPRVLERRGHRSWSLIYFEPDDGPFDPGLTTAKLTPSARYGQITITSDTAVFDADDERRLLRITHQGQYVKETVNGDGKYTDAVKVAGIGIDRIFGVTITGTFSGTITLERSISNQNDFSRVIEFTTTSAQTYNDSFSASHDSGDKAGTSDDVYNVTSDADASNYGRLDNVTAFYRLAVYPGDWASGTADLELTNDGGSQVGIARISDYIGPSEVRAEIIRPFSKAGASDLWDIGTWCAANEFPNVSAFAHGRFWAFRRRQMWSSEPDDYFSFQDGVDPDNSVQLTLRSNSAEGVRWARELDFLCVGTSREEYVIRSTSISEPVGPTSTEPSLQGEEGSALIEAQVAGGSILYTHRNRSRVMQFTHNPRALSEGSFISVDLTRLNPEACEIGIINTVVQQEPDRRIYSVLADGTVKPSLFRREEEIMAWGTMTTQGIIEDACVLRELDQDVVYFIVRRFINGSWVRMIERLRSEIVLNPEDMVHLDSMLETPITRPDVGITPSAINTGAVTVDATDDVFSMSDVGKVLWLDGGRLTIGAYVNAQQITGTITYPLRGKPQNLIDNPQVMVPKYVPPGLWGIATPVTSVTDLDHLEGETVQIWADMTYAGTAVVSGGSVSLPAAASRVFVGLPFASTWKSLKLAYGAQKGTAVGQPKRVPNMGLVLSDTSDCIYMGDEPGKLKPLIKLQHGSVLGSAPRFFTGEAYEAFNGSFDHDPRIIITTVNPGPATIKALIPNIQINERP